MWISSDCPFSKKYAFRVYLGGINGLSGRTVTEDLNAQRDEQDYLILPQQKRLDGIMIKPGIIKQLVATQRIPPLEMAAAASKRPTDTREISTTTSIQWQMTGMGTMGGLQLQVIPEHDFDHMHFSNMPDVVFKDGHSRSYIDPPPADAESFDVLKTPSELNLKVGQRIFVKDMNRMQPDIWKTLKDLWLESPVPLKTDTLELEVCHDVPPKWLLVIHQPETANLPVFFEVFRILA